MTPNTPLSHFLTRCSPLQVVVRLNQAFGGTCVLDEAASDVAAPTVPAESKPLVTDRLNLVLLNKVLLKVLKDEHDRGLDEMPWIVSLVEQAQDAAFPNNGMTVVTARRTGLWHNVQRPGMQDQLEFHKDLSVADLFAVGNAYEVLVHVGKCGVKPGCPSLRDAHTEIVVIVGFTGGTCGEEKPDALVLWVSERDKVSGMLDKALKMNGSDSGVAGSERYCFPESTTRDKSYRSGRFVFDIETHIEERQRNDAAHRDLFVGIIGTHVDRVETRYLLQQITIVQPSTIERRDHTDSPDWGRSMLIPYSVECRTGNLKTMVLTPAQLLYVSSRHLHGLDVSEWMRYSMLAPIDYWWKNVVTQHQDSYLNIHPCVLAGVQFSLVANLGSDTLCAKGSMAPGTRKWTFSFLTCSDLASALEITLDDARGKPKYSHHSITMVYDHDVPGVLTFTIGAASTVMTSPRRSDGV